MSPADQAANSIHGVYVESCQKRAYATERLAAAQLRLLQARGRTEQSHYKCAQCGMFHLSGRRPEAQYRIEATTEIQIGTTRIQLGRKVKPTETMISMRITFTVKDGTERFTVYDMTPEQGREMIDAFIQAVYDNNEADPPGDEGDEAAA